LAIAERDQAVVGDGHAMGVAVQIVHHVFGAPEGTFQVHHPIQSMERPMPSGEDWVAPEASGLHGSAVGHFEKPL
jgi:hypothetical protein